jgi:tetratricopeptide (TPR) repeat protein
LVTAGLIVRNEELFLADCLESLKDIVDDIVIVDTGSTDSTLSIARSFGARLFEFPWNHDFSAARNRVLDEIRSGWVLYIDADERVRSPGRQPISKFLNQETDAGGYVRFRPRLGYSFYREPRLFRHDPSIRFRGRIHETHVPDLLNFAERHRLNIVDTPVIIEHFGYEGDQSHKVKRNIPLLEVEVLAQPARTYLWHHLAEMLSIAGQKQKAIEVCKRGLTSPAVKETQKDMLDRRELVKTLVRLLLEQGESVGDLIKSQLEDAPRDWALLYFKARSDLLAGDARSALAIGRELSALDPDELQDGLVAYDLRLFGDLAFDLMGAAFLHEGLHAEAAAAFSRAFELAPNNLAYYAKAVAMRSHADKLAKHE